MNVLPPTLSWKERRSDDIYAVNPGLTLGEQNIDLNYLYSTNTGGAYHYSSVHLAGNLPYNFSYNTEMAAELGEKSTHAIYASLMYSGWKFGGSLEWKDYRNFLLGSGFNDPPTLVKEHSYKVLNRSTHVPQLTSERGFQAEVYYRSESGHMLTLNSSRARNESFQVYVFEEYFAELYSPIGESASINWFLDFARDPFKDEPQRYASGGILETPVSGRWSILAEMEYQYIERTGFLPGAVHNWALITGLSKGARLSVSLTWELSTDPFLTDDTATLEIERGSRHWIGVDTKYKISKRQTLTVFAGQRRGGPACTSGICYEVLDFEGLELRLTSKF